MNFFTDKNQVMSENKVYLIFILEKHNWHLKLNCF